MTGSLTTRPALALDQAVELRHVLRRAEEIASAWHAHDPNSNAAPRIAWLAGEATCDLLAEVKFPPLTAEDQRLTTDHAAAAAPPPPPPPIEELAHYRMSTDGGPVMIAVPAFLSVAEVAELEQFFALIVRRYKRNAERSRELTAEDRRLTTDHAAAAAAADGS